MILKKFVLRFSHRGKWQRAKTVGRQVGCKLSNEVRSMNPYDVEATDLHETTGRVTKNKHSISDLIEE